MGIIDTEFFVKWVELYALKWYYCKAALGWNKVPDYWFELKYLEAIAMVAEDSLHAAVWN